MSLGGLGTVGLVLLPFAVAVLMMAAIAPHSRRAAVTWAGLATLAGCGIVAAVGPDIFAGNVLRWRIDWLPQIGLAFGFRMDGLAWMFAWLICAIGALVVLYGAYYLAPEDPPRRFFVFLLLFMGAMLGVVLADNLLLLVVFWELTSLSSFLLIGYWHQRSDAREGARMALTITGAGGLALLAGVLLIGHIAGSYELDVVLASGDAIRAHPLYLPALVLVLLGCFTKSAQFPFHFWLPHAMAAPTPVSAFLHSATMVKAGVFLLARLYPALGGSEPWFWIVTLTGLATLLVGAYLAIFKHDLKGLLAYSTISHLGLITLLFGLDEPLAMVAGVFHILNHATFKASLFMAAGIIDHETGSRDMRQLNGLWKYMPRTGALAMVAAAAMAGVPLANGFLSKEMFFAETLAKEGHGLMELLLPAGALVAAALSVAYSTRFIHDVFFNGEPVGLTRTPHEPPRFMRAPVELLVVLCIAVGLAPAIVIGPILASASQAALGAPLPEYHLALWHGFNAPLLMSGVAMVAGILLYFGLQRFINLHSIVHLPRGGRDIFMFLIDRVVRAATAGTRALQNGSLQRYLLLLVVLAFIAASLPFVRNGPVLEWAAPRTPAGAGEVIVWAIGVLTAVATVSVHRQRLLAVVLLGATGLVVALAFVYLSAPDLALTQVLVEVVTIVLLMLALRWLPAQSAGESGVPNAARRWRDSAVAVAVGAGVSALVWMVLQRPVDSIAPYFLENTVPMGGGANAVNVIIVDFRGFDTLGEITVLGMAGLIVFAVLATMRGRSGAGTPSAVDDLPSPSSSLLLALISRMLLPLATLVSIYLFLRGHNEPGGGFIAGLVLAIAMILVFVANGTRWVDARMQTDFRSWIGWGLLIAGLTGVGSWYLGSPFLTSSFDYPVAPLIGAVPLATASLFDLGVYLTVVGATMVALSAIARLRAPDAPRPTDAAGAAGEG